MLALIAAAILLAGGSYMAFGPHRFHSAPIFWCVAWGMMLLLYRLLGPNYDYDRYIVLFSFGCTLLWLVGHFIITEVFDRFWDTRKVRSRPSLRVYEIKNADLFLIACTLIGMGAPVNFMHASGVDLHRILNVTALFDTMQSTHAAMQEQKVEQDSVNKLCLLFALAGVNLGGILLGLGRQGPRTRLLLCLAPVAPYILMMLLTTLRTMMIVPLLVLFAGWVGGLALVGRDRDLFTPKRVFGIGGAVAALAILVIVMQSIRAQDYQFRRIGETLDHLRLWVAGYQPALTYWMQHIWDGSMKGGSATFRIIAGFMGKDDTKLAYGAGAVPVGDGDAGNAMTALKFFVEDFGILGALVFCMIWGLVSGALSAVVRRGKITWAGLFAVNLATVIWAPNSWFLGYGTRLLSPLLVTVFLAVFATMSEREAPTRRPGPAPRPLRRRTPASASPGAGQQP